MSRHFELLRGAGSPSLGRTDDRSTPTGDDGSLSIYGPEVRPDDSQGVSAFDLAPLGATGGSALETSGRKAHLRQITEQEEFKLVQQLFLNRGASAPKATLFATIEPPDDNGQVCARTAEILAAQIEGSVCVVDANLRKPSLHHRFGMELGSGLSGVLQHGRPVNSLVQQSGKHLWVLTSGPSIAEPRTLLAAERLRPLFDGLRQQFDYVLVCAPPFTDGPETMLLSQLVDGVVPVIRAHATRRERALRIKETLEAAHVPILGVVLSHRRFPIPRALYRWI